MNILDILLQSPKGGPLDSLSSMSGLRPNQMQQLLGQVMPVIAGGLRNGISSNSGLESLINVLNNGNHDRYYDQPNTLDSQDTRIDGNGILGHVLGNKEASRSLAGHAAAKTGIDSTLIKKMLPIIATVVMGAMNKRASTEGMLGSHANAINNDSILGMLNGFLDVGGDGSVIDDVLRIGAKALIK